MRQLHSAFPAVASLAAFMLVLLALLAGSSPGFLEDYNIVTFNTSELGKNPTRFPTFPTSAGSGLPTTTTGGKCTGIFCSAATAAAGSVESHIASALDNVTDGIADFYSLHVLDICKGAFTPNLDSNATNATTPNAGRNVTECTKLSPAGYDVLDILGQELGGYNLADLGFTPGLQNAFAMIHRTTEASAIIFIIGVAFTGLSMLSSLVVALVLLLGEPRVAWTKIALCNAFLAGIAFALLILSASIVTSGARIVVDEINDMGAVVGLSASVGTNFLIITWIAVVLMLSHLIYWICQSRRGYAREGSEHGEHGEHRGDPDEFY